MRLTDWDPGEHSGSGRDPGEAAGSSLALADEERWERAGVHRTNPWYALHHLPDNPGVLLWLTTHLDSDLQ